MSITKLQHNRVTLALHKVRDGNGRPLLLLHGLGEDASRVSNIPLQWAGPIYALDFTGHGQSHRLPHFLWSRIISAWARHH